MLCIILGMVATVLGALAEQVPCNMGKPACEASESLSIVSNNYYCCETGFNMQWKNELVNGSSTTECFCNRHFYVTDCIEDRVQCEGASSVTSDGTLVKCCKNGDSMNSVTNSVINGVRADYCRCIKYVTSAVGGPLRRIPTERPRDQNIPPPDFRNGFGHFAGRFLEGFGQGLREHFQAAGDLSPQTSGNPDTAAGLPRETNQVQGSRSRQPLFDLQQRMFQLIQPRRLLQPVGNRGVGSGFIDRVSQNPLVMQLVDPRWWFNQDWRGAFGGRQNTAGVTPRPTPAGTTNPYSSNNGAQIAI
ncbi:unnamed protein product [Lymnaea stagnalis]|uniref:Uncharacterized protein n=1 Tax=Lymnaea stagnalis TaxID=6523 RepID=A0AAV2HWB5_LYMST